MSLLFDPTSKRPQVWSNGSGTQSCAIAAFIIKGKLPKPDIAYWVNTERENSDTKPYQEKYVWPALAKIGVKVHEIWKSDYAYVDLTCRKGTTILMPGYTNQSGEVGKLPQYCTGEWKREVGKRWLKEQGIKEHDLWIGFSCEEMQRVKAFNRGKSVRLVYPLLHLGLRREHCVLACLEMGWPKPPRSSCWCCPNKCNQEWQEMKEQRPEDFRMAVLLDRELREKDANFFLHESCIPLDQVDFKDRNGGFFESGCKSGFCFV